MPHQPSSPRPRRLRPAGLLVGLLHLGLVLVLWTLPPQADRRAAAPQQPPLLVTLLPLLQPLQPRQLPQPPQAPARRPPLPVPALLPVPRAPVEPQAITLPAAPAPVTPAAPVAAAALPASAAPPAPLNLALPRGASAPWRQRNPALDDPRSNTAKLTLEQKLANAMGGDGTWQVERLDGDHIRYRRGDECVMATRSRAGQLELGNGAFRNSWLVGNC